MFQCLMRKNIKKIPKKDKIMYCASLKFHIWIKNFLYFFLFYENIKSICFSLNTIWIEFWFLQNDVYIFYEAVEKKKSNSDIVYYRKITIFFLIKNWKVRQISLFVKFFELKRDFHCKPDKYFKMILCYYL